MLRRGLSQIALRVSGGAGLCVPECCCPRLAAPCDPAKWPVRICMRV